VSSGLVHHRCELDKTPQIVTLVLLSQAFTTSEKEQGVLHQRGDPFPIKGLLVSVPTLAELIFQCNKEDTLTAALR
jgi:hypothetical protein